MKYVSAKMCVGISKCPSISNNDYKHKLMTLKEARQHASKNSKLVPLPQRKYFQRKYVRERAITHP